MSSVNQQQTPALTLEDYIGEAYVKCANIILGSRIFQNEQHKPLVDRRSGRWFLLEIDELAGLTQRLEPWRRDVYAPLIIEVSIRPWDTSTVMPGDSSSQPAAHATGTAAGASPGGSMLLERWTLCFAPGVNSSGNSRASMDTAAVYKRLILLIRSLYSYVRVLPAYRMYRACKRHGGELFNTTYSLSTTADPSMQPIHPWPHQQQALGAAAAAAAGGNGNGGRMCQFAFTPVETLGGAFSIHVEYQPATTVHILEQTTIPVSMPRIIADYVDSPYARSAPNAAADAISKQTAGRAVSRLSGPEGPLALLRASQHHTPLVRHSWSSRDVSGPTVVQRGFSPVGNTSANSQQQHRRTSSQGSGSGLPISPAAGGQSPVQAVAGSSSSSWGRPPLPHGGSSLHASSQGLAAAAAAQGSVAAGVGYSSSLPSGYSALMGSVQGSSGLPPASPVTPLGGGRSPLFRSSSLSTAAAIGAGGGAAVPTAPAQGTQQQLQAASRLGTSPTLLQQLRQHQQYPRPPVQPLSPQSTQQGFHVKLAHAQQAVPGSAQQHNELAPKPVPASGTGESGPSAPAGTALAVVSDSSNSGRHWRQEGAAGAGVHSQQQLGQKVSSSEGGSQAAAADTAGASSAENAAAAAAAADGGVAITEPLSSGDSGRTASAPVSIPYSKVKGVRARSVSDLAKLDAETAHPMQLPLPDDDANQAAAGASAASAGPAAGEQGSVAGDSSPVAGPPAVNTRSIGGVAAGLSSMGGGFKSSSSSGLLKVHEQHLQQHQQARQQQLVQAPSSAPAAPRGMLGQLLSAGSGPTSPAFSPRSSAAQRSSGSRVVAAAMAAAAAAAGGTREAYHTCHAHPAAATAAERGRHVDSGDDSDSSGTSSAADGVLSSTPTPRGAIIIRPNPLMHMQHAPAPASASVTAAGGTAATSGSPGGSSSCGSQPNSVGSRVLGRRALVGQVFVGPGSVGSGPLVGVGSGPYLAGLGVQPSTPSAPHSYLGSSPQLPFAFTPSAASLGTSLMSLADAQRQMMAPGGASGSGTSAALKQLPAPLSRPGAAAAAAAASAAAGIAAAGAAGAGSPSATVAGAAAGAGAAAVSAGTAVSSAVPVGTPSPPLLYPPATGGQVSFIRDISGLATIRRPSWSSRSSSFDIAAAGSATLPHHLSMSPGMADLMDPSLMLGYSSSHGSSAPGVASLRIAAGGGGSSSSAAAPGVVYRWNLGQQPGASIGPQMQLQHSQQQQQGSESDSQHQQQQQEEGQGQESSDAAIAGSAQASTGELGATAAGSEGATPAADAAASGRNAQEAPAAAGDASASGAPVGDAFGGSMGHDESESDLLPFVLDAEPLGQMQGVGQAGPGAGQYGGPGAGSTLGQAGRIAATAGAVAGVAGAAVAGTGGVAGAQRDVAVGAFLRMVQEAAATPVGRLDRRQAVWTQQQQQQQQQGELGVASAGLGMGSAPVCVGDAVHQVQELAGQLQQLLFPEPYA